MSEIIPNTGIEAVDNVVGKVEEKLEEVGENIKDLPEEVAPALDKASEALGDLFKK